MSSHCGSVKRSVYVQVRDKALDFETSITQMSSVGIA